MFEQYVPYHNRLSGRAYEKYDNELAAVVNKRGVTFIGRSREVLCKDTYVGVYQNNTEWAMRPVGDGEGGYKAGPTSGKHSSTKTGWSIKCASFVANAGLTLNGIYVGKVKDGMVVFSKIPTELKK